MSAPSYSSTNFLASAFNQKQATDSANAAFNAAKAEYEKSQNKYLGENGWNLATKQAEESASKNSLMAGKNAAATSMSAARSNGMSKAKSVALASANGNKAATDSYGSLYQSGLSNAITNNNNTVNSYGNKLNAVNSNNSNNINAANQLLNGGSEMDKNNYNNSVNKWSAGMGLAGGILSGVASALSDENMKDIHCSSRHDELLNKLRGLK